MKQMRNRWWCALLVVAMLTNLTACGAVTKEEKTQRTEHEEQETEQAEESEKPPVKEAPEENGPEETVSIVPEEKTAPLNVIKTSIGCQYSGSVNDEWHSVETMQDFC